jgi:hypothetical protein
MWRRIFMFLGLATAACDKPVSTARPSPQPPSMPEARAKLLDRIGNINDFSRPRPLVTLAEFFEGNNDYGSIGYNLPDSPPPGKWYGILQAVAKRPEVSDVRVEVKDLEDPDGWPSTDTIWIITTAPPEEVRRWLPDRIAPDDIIEGFETAPSPVERYEIPAGYRAVGVWYD